MINYQDEIKHFKPSLDVDDIEKEIAGMNLTDMNDLMMLLVRRSAVEKPVPAAAFGGPEMPDDADLTDE